MGLVTNQQRQLLMERGRVGDLEKLLDDPPVIKLHTPNAGATWLISAIDPADRERAWGLCDTGMGTPELGWVSLAELAGLHDRFGVEVCRDEAFRPSANLGVYASVAARLGVIVA